MPISAISMYYNYYNVEGRYTPEVYLFDTISKLVDNVPEMDEEQEEMKDFTEDYYLEFYKSSVTVVESQDTNIFKLAFSESTPHSFFQFQQNNIFMHKNKQFT